MVRAKEKEKVKKAAAKAKAKASLTGSATDAPTAATAGSKKTVRIVEPTTVPKTKVPPPRPPTSAVAPPPAATPTSISAPRSKGKGKAAKFRKAQIASANDAVSKKVDKTDSCVIYLGHIPGAFQEKEMHSFFRQFGDVVRVKLFRGIKAPHRSKGYGFIEFTSSETARVVAEVMDGYFLDERKLVSNVVPKHNLHEEMFRGKRKAKRGREESEDEDDGDEDGDEEEGEEGEGENGEDKTDVKAKKTKQEAKGGSNASSDKKAAETVRTLKKKQSRLKELGIDYEFLSSLSEPVPAAN